MQIKCKTDRGRTKQGKDEMAQAQNPLADLPKPKKMAEPEAVQAVEAPAPTITKTAAEMREQLNGGSHEN